MPTSKGRSRESCPKPRLQTRSSHASGRPLISCTVTASNALCSSGRVREEMLIKISDYDVAVFLRDLTDRWHEIDRLAAIETDILADTGAFIHSMPYRAGSYRERSPLMHEIRRDGIDL